MRKLKLYLDTSVWNFVFADDAPRERDVTKEFFDVIEKEIYEIFISGVVIKEVNDAPQPKQTDLLNLIGKYKPVKLENTREAEELAKIYMERGIVPEKKRDDALHVAIATVTEVDALITWNYKHLANLRKAELFHGISLEMGYFKKLEIITPMEVSSYESY